MFWTVSETFTLLVLLARFRTLSFPQTFGEVYGAHSLGSVGLWG